MIDKIFISARFFTQEELQEFKNRHGYEVTEISYACKEEIDFSQPEEKEFLMKYGTPRILARFGY
nr:MAG TPA: Enterococcin [Caudoviricetes sp.]